MELRAEQGARGDGRKEAKAGVRTLQAASRGVPTALGRAVHPTHSGSRVGEAAVVAAKRAAKKNKPCMFFGTDRAGDCAGAKCPFLHESAGERQSRQVQRELKQGDEVGTVKTWDSEKKYGFITRDKNSTCSSISRILWMETD